MVHLAEAGSTKGLQNQLSKDSNVSLSLRFGFLGLGMGGSSIAAACADIEMAKKNLKYPYTALLVNTNSIDLEKIEVKNTLIKKMTIGNGKGAGRNIDLGEKTFLENKETILSAVKTQFQESDFVWIVAGLGGGTGTGSVVQAAKLLHENGFKKKFGLILTLPRKSEGRTVLSNALERLQTISKLMKGLGSIILVDNQKLYNYYTEFQPNASVSEYLRFSNEYVAQTLHELNTVTASLKPYAEYHFDSSEFENLIKEKGILHLAKFSVPANSVDTEQSLTYVGRLKEHIENGVLSDGYKLQNASRLAVSIVTNENIAKRVYNMQFNNAIETLIEDISPIATEKPVAEYVYDAQNNNEVYFYAVFAGLSLPSSIKTLLEEEQKLKEREESLKTEDDVLSALSGFTRSKDEQEEDVFSTIDSSKNNPKEDEDDDDPFAHL